MWKWRQFMFLLPFGDLFGFKVRAFDESLSVSTCTESWWNSTFAFNHRQSLFNVFESLSGFLTFLGWCKLVHYNAAHVVCSQNIFFFKTYYNLYFNQGNISFYWLEDNFIWIPRCSFLCWGSEGLTSRMQHISSPQGSLKGRQGKAVYCRTVHPVWMFHGGRL